MCVEIYNRDTGKTAENPPQLREMLGTSELIKDPIYSRIIDSACLCQVDCRATTEKAGYHYEEIGGDPMHVEIWKDKPIA